MLSCTYKKFFFSKCNGFSCNLVTNNETVRIRKDLVLHIDLYTFAQYVFHQNDRVILLSYRQFIISTNVIECYMI